jgi:dethiobiotin synthetase
MECFFITASGTGVGKTFVTASLCWQLRASGKKVTALKPVISGYDPDDFENDSAQLLESCGIEPASAVMETISPWRYRAPLAPPMAAAKEGRPVDMDALAEFCREGYSPTFPPSQVGEASSTLPTCRARQRGEYIFVEGVGGVMAPLTDRHTVLDWMRLLGWPAILVGGSYLGAISHTLTALEVLKAATLPVRVLVVSASEGSTVPLADTVATLEKYVPGTIPVVPIPRLPVGRDRWKQSPPLGWVCDL